MGKADRYLVQGNRGLIALLSFFFWLSVVSIIGFGADFAIGFSFVLSVITCFVVFREFYSFEDRSWKYYIGVSLFYVYFNGLVMLYGYFAFVIQKVRDFFSL